MSGLARGGRREQMIRMCGSRRCAKVYGVCRAIIDGAPFWTGLVLIGSNKSQSRGRRIGCADGPGNSRLKLGWRCRDVLVLFVPGDRMSGWKGREGGRERTCSRISSSSPSSTGLNIHFATVLLPMPSSMAASKTEARRTLSESLRLALGRSA